MANRIEFAKFAAVENPRFSLARCNIIPCISLKRVCRQWISSSAQHPVAVVQGNGICAGLYSTSCRGRTPCRRHNPRVAIARVARSPSYSRRDQITRFSAIFDLRAATPATIDETRSCRANTVARFLFGIQSANLLVFVWKVFSFDKNRPRRSARTSATQSYDEHCRSGGTCRDDGIGGFGK